MPSAGDSQGKDSVMGWPDAKCGYLDKKNRSAFAVVQSEYQPRWVTLERGVLAYYSEDKTELKRSISSFKVVPGGLLSPKSRSTPIQCVFDVEVCEASDKVPLYHWNHIYQFTMYTITNVS